MSTAGKGGNAGDIEALARQYFSAWGDALRHAAVPPGSPPGGDGQGGWQQAIDWWARHMPTAASGAADDAVHRFREQAGGWYGTMQQVAAQFAGRDASSADVAQAWKQAVQGQGEGLLQWMLQGARGQTAAGGPDLLKLLERLQQDLGPWLQSPAFGPGREHQARWQALLRAQQEYQTHSRDYVEQIKQALDDAFALFEQRLAEHEQPGSQLTSARAMFDLWIEVAEEAYAKVALSESFQRVYAALGNAQMRLRGATQQEIERVCEAIGLPTRTEMDAAHRRITELERLVRRMAEAGAPTQPGAKATAGPTQAPASKPNPNPKPKPKPKPKPAANATPRPAKASKPRRAAAPKSTTAAATPRKRRP